jgi:hypothetical protein
MEEKQPSLFSPEAKTKIDISKTKIFLEFTKFGQKFQEKTLTQKDFDALENEFLHLTMAHAIFVGTIKNIREIIDKGGKLDDIKEKVKILAEYYDKKG